MLFSSCFGGPAFVFGTQCSCVTHLTSGFCHEVGENCALLGYYAANSGNFIPTFWDNVSVLSSGVTVHCIIIQKSTVFICLTYFLSS